MRKIILIASAVLISVVVQAQNVQFQSYEDTANYLIGLAKNKSAYIDQPFSVFYNDLKIKPVRIRLNYGGLKMNDKADFGRSIEFDFNGEKDFSKSHFIILDWYTHPSYDELYPLLFPGEGKLKDLKAIINLFKGHVLRDIIVKDYSLDDQPPAPVGHSLVVKAQNVQFQSYEDTANYLLGLEKNKSVYTDKPFSFFYNDLKIKPVRIIFDYGGTNLKDKTDYGRSLRFYFNGEEDFSKTHFIILEWYTHPSSEQLYPLLFPGNGKPQDLNAIMSLYMGHVLRDIIVKDYGQDDMKLAPVPIEH